MMRMASSAGLAHFLTVLLVLSSLWAQQADKGMRPEAQGEPLTPDWCRELPRPAYAQLERVSLSDNWFEVYRIRPGVFALYEPHQYEEVISYLITGSRRALLFDTGLGIGDMNKIVHRLTRLPVTVLNSHTHFDHIGNNWQFRDVLGVNSDYTRSHLQGAAREQLQEVISPERLCGHLPPGFNPRTYAIPRFKISRFVEDGSVIDLGERRLEILLTPGHCPDALCLLDRENRLLFSGDTFYAGPIFLYVPETDGAAYKHSVDRLAQLVPHLELVLPSHNFPAAKPEMLTRLSDAFGRVQRGGAPFTLSNGRREYKFDGFSLLTAP